MSLQMPAKSRVTRVVAREVTMGSTHTKSIASSIYSNNTMSEPPGQGIVHPHEHDVLSGRGNFVNYHAGNEHFRALVRKYKMDYVQCPKPQKGKFSKLIVDEIRARDPPGRFLKQDASSKLWYDIGEKKALDKTRQALREGAPELMKDMTSPDDGSDGDTDGRREVSPRGNTSGVPDDLLRRSSLGAMSPADAMRRNSAAGSIPPEAFRRNSTGAGSVTNDMSNSFMVGNMMNNMQSPVMGTRLPLQISPHISPGPSVMPGGGMRLPSNMPMSPDMTVSMTEEQMQSRIQQLNAQQLQMQNLDQLQMSPPLMQNRFMNQQLGQLDGMQEYAAAQLDILEKQRQLEILKAKQREMEAMQNKLYAAEHFEPRPIESPSTNAAHFAGKMRKPKSSANPALAMLHPAAGLSSQSDHAPKRKPPPPGLKRENSLKMEKVFNSSGETMQPLSTKEDTGHLSAMSLSIGDMQVDTTLSSVFDSSLQISVDDTEFRDQLSPLTKSKKRLSSKLEGRNPFDMSVATLGDKVSDAGNMSVNTLGDKFQESEGNMSFSKVFEESTEIG